MDQEQRELLNYVAKNINYISPFNGDKFSLSSFINRIESLIPIIEPLSNELKVIILGYITDKVVGKAKECVIRKGNVNSWLELKSLLIKNFGERVPINDIVDELKLCRCDSTVENFYNKIKALLCRINNSAILNGENSPEQVSANQRLALKHFISDLPPLAKNLVACHNHDSLEDAYDLLAKFGYLSFKHQNKTGQDKNNFSRNRPTNFRDNYFDSARNRPTNSRDNHFDSGNSRNSGNFNNRHYNNEPNAQRNNFRQYANSGHTRYSNNNNRHHNYVNNNGVEPMDISVNETRTNNNSNCEQPGNQNNNREQNFQIVTENNYLI